MAALIGVIAVALTFGIAELLAALGMWVNLLDTTASPISSLGSAFIALTPEWLKEWAIRQFGTNDKTALRVGMLFTLVVVAALVGVIGRRSPRMATGLAGLLIVVTGVAILTRAGSTLVDLVPLVIGAALGMWFLVSVLRLALQVPPTAKASPGPGSDPVVDSSVAGGPVVTNDAAGGAAPGPDAGAGAGAADGDPNVPDPARREAAVSDPITSSTPGKVVLTGADHPMSVVTRERNRRSFFKLAALGAVAAVVTGALAKWIPSAAEVEASRAAVVVPKATDAQKPDAGTLDNVPGITSYVTPNDEFYRIDTAFTFPGTTAENWKLKIHGAVDNPIEITYADLIKRPMVERMITLTCVSNEVGGDLAGNATWQGVRIADLLAEAKPRAEADCVLSTSAQDGFTVTTPIAALTDGRDALLAVKMNGEPLPIAHGFPVRMVVPGLYGYVSATKWVVDLEITSFDEVTSFWTDRGWSPQAPIKTASRIDVPASFAQLKAGKVAVAGVAWAQHRGIKAVQVQVDDGEWSDATLSTPVSVDTWRQWVYEWDATAGQHTLRVRAVDGKGELQTGSRQDVMPDGATGWHSRVVTIG